MILAKPKGTSFEMHQGTLVLPPFEGSGAKGRVYAAATLARLASEGRTAELAALGLSVAVDAAVPAGKVRVGEPTMRKVDGVATRVWTLEDAPPPPPDPTPAEKLARAGLSLDDLKALGVQVAE